MSFGISSSGSRRPAARRSSRSGSRSPWRPAREERETRGFISITMISSVAGLTANWTLEPPVSTPTARMTAIAWSRSIWYWRSVSDICGATVTESPVWTPIGSTFSIEQTITTLSAPSRITSSSNSPQPSTDSSISTWPIGEAARPCATIRSNSSCGARDAAAAAAEREGRADDQRQPELAARRARLLEARGDRVARRAQPGGLHRRVEQLAVLGAADRVVARADQLDAEALQRAVLVERLGEVQRRLAAERRQQRVGALALDHLRDDLGQQRLDVGRRRELRVGHDRRRVGVHEHDLVALLAAAPCRPARPSSRTPPPGRSRSGRSRARGSCGGRRA